jgi:hypothetical protein
MKKINNIDTNTHQQIQKKTNKKFHNNPKKKTLIEHKNVLIGIALKIISKN